jgi:hypothetical protein
MTAPDLLPCPFCGSTMQVAMRDAMLCLECYAAGPQGEDRDTSWNRRATTQAADAALERAAQAVVDACDRARMAPRPGCGIGGQTIDANLRASVYHGVDAWPVEELRSAIYALQSAPTPTPLAAALDVPEVRALEAAARALRDRFETKMRGRNWAVKDMEAARRLDHAIAALAALKGGA